jgi:putative ABC transport system substrate-binding protein
LESDPSQFPRGSAGPIGQWSQNFRCPVLVNPNNPLANAFVTDVTTAAAGIGLRVEVLAASTSHDIDTAFATLVERRADALLVGLDPLLFVSRRVQLATLAARHVVPAIYPFREDAVAGGLVSYGPSNTDLVRQAGIYTGRVLKGEKPAEMPILRATRFDFIINLTTAKALGITVPPTLLARADEVIE